MKRGTKEKIIALVLIFTILVVNLVQPISAMAFEADLNINKQVCEYNIQEETLNAKSSDMNFVNMEMENVKVDPILNPELLNDDLSNSIYYNNFEYYEGNSDEIVTASTFLGSLYLFGKAAGSFIWKKALKSTVMKWVAGTVASAYLSEIAINGLPKVKATSVVGYGKIEYGHEVKTIQILLQRNGYSVDADSYWGPKTYSAIRAFQSKHRLTVDGYVGKQTYEALADNARG